MKFLETIAQIVRNSDRRTELLSHIVEALDNQSTVVNEKLDRLIEARDNQSTAVNERLDRLIEARDDLSTANKMLVKLIEAQDKQARAVIERLDKVIESLRATTLDKGNQPRDDATVRSDSGRKLYICNSIHENDRTYAENVSEFCDEVGISSTIIELGSDGNRPELLQCLEGTEVGVLGFNSLLDHSWIGSEPFLAIAEARKVPVTQWILDHPSSRWCDFYQSTSTNSRYLFHSEYSEGYFHKYCLANCVTASVVGVGPNKRSRVSKFSKNQFFTRHINCLIPLNLARVGGTLQDLKLRVEALEPRLSKVISEAFMLARYDLLEPLETHLTAVLNAFAISLPNADFNSCMQILEEKVQVFRRLHVFKIARDYPVLIQSDESARPYSDGGRAEFAQDVGMQLTLSRMPAARAVVSLSHLNDMIYDRTLNGLNAGCINIVEDSLAHRRAFQNSKNALFFRYDDGSLRECLELVCSRPEEAYQIAEAGLGLRDAYPIRFGGFHNIIDPKSRIIDPKSRLNANLLLPQRKEATL